MLILIPVKGIDLRGGMKVRKEATMKERALQLAPYVDRCSKGLHFGNGCYDTISTWWVESWVSGK